MQSHSCAQFWKSLFGGGFPTIPVRTEFPSDAILIPLHNLETITPALNINSACHLILLEKLICFFSSEIWYLKSCDNQSSLI